MLQYFGNFNFVVKQATVVVLKTHRSTRRTNCTSVSFCTSRTLGETWTDKCYPRQISHTHSDNMPLKTLNILTDEPLAPLGPWGPCIREDTSTAIWQSNFIISVESKWMTEWVKDLQADQGDLGDREDRLLHQYPVIRWDESRNQILKKHCRQKYYCEAWIMSEMKKLQYNGTGARTRNEYLVYELNRYIMVGGFMEFFY